MIEIHYRDAGEDQKLLVVALMVTLFLAAMEATIAALATPTIARQLNGFDLMSLIFSSFLLASALSTPIFGRLADLFGRKRTLSIGIIIFLLGCLLCGLSMSMPFLIASRAIQGIGAGSIYTLVNTIAGDAFPIEERAGLMGALGSVWGIAGLLGPLFGGMLIELLSWHWVFLINIPLGIPSLILLNLSLSERFDRTYVEHRNITCGIFTKPTISSYHRYVLHRDAGPGCLSAVVPAKRTGEERDDLGIRHVADVTFLAGDLNCDGQAAHPP